MVRGFLLLGEDSPAGLGEAGPDRDGAAEVRDGVGTPGSGPGPLDGVTSGFASFEGRPPSSADTIPVTVPTATTTEAAVTIAARPADRLRSALRSADRRARKPDTYRSLTPAPAAFPRSGEASGPAALRPA